MRLIVQSIALLILALPASAAVAPFPQRTSNGVMVSEWVDPRTGARYLLFLATTPSGTIQGKDVRIFGEPVHLTGSIPASPTLVVVRADLPTAVTDQPLEK